MTRARPRRLRDIPIQQIVSIQKLAISAQGASHDFQKTPESRNLDYRNHALTASSNKSKRLGAYSRAERRQPETQSHQHQCYTPYKKFIQFPPQTLQPPWPAICKLQTCRHTMGQFARIRTIHAHRTWCGGITPPQQGEGEGREGMPAGRQIAERGFDPRTFGL